MTAERAAAIVGALTRWEMWTILTSDCGWSFDDAEARIAETLITLILA